MTSFTRFLHAGERTLRPPLIHGFDGIGKAITDTMKSVREMLRGTGGIAIAAVVVVGAGVAVFFSVHESGPSPMDASRQRTFMDAESGKPFQATLSAGDSLPLKSPFTGKLTGVEAEMCNWTADGKPKPTPDPVLLNSAHLPPIAGPTFCPVCHRLVVGHNPPALAGDQPPRTEAEYAKREH